MLSDGKTIDDDVRKGILQESKVKTSSAPDKKHRYGLVQYPFVSIFLFAAILFLFQINYIVVHSENDKNDSPLSNWKEHFQNKEASSSFSSFSSLSTSSTKTSLSILMEAVQNVNRPIPDQHQLTDDKGYIDLAKANQLCTKFEKVFNGTRFSTEENMMIPLLQKQRRIFAGGLIADDSWHTIGANALETYGIFHSVTFIESNRTQSYQPRPFRFTPQSKDLEILQSGIYGPNTSVNVVLFVQEDKEISKAKNMAREHLMREEILHQWKKQGMTKEDIGLIMDVDEIPTREILRAAQICTLQENSWSTDPITQKCRSPILRLSTPMFEGSPKCMHKSPMDKQVFRRFFNPAMVIGACIEGIGDSNLYPNIPRGATFTLKNEENRKEKKQIGNREEGYGLKYDYSKILNGVNGYFPLYNAADFRGMQAMNLFGGVGYHIHNFFESSEKLRFKYAYFGHVHHHAYTAPLGVMNADLNLFIKCAHNISDEGNRKERVINGIEILKEMYDIPLAFQLPGYADRRHEEMVALVEKDEEEYGRADKFDGHHLYHEKSMLTHPGKRHIEADKNKTNDT